MSVCVDEKEIGKDQERNTDDSVKVGGHKDGTRECLKANHYSLQ